MNRLPFRCMLGLAWLILSLSARAARAELVFLPDSRAHQFQTYALFNEFQSELLLRSAGRFWGALGGSLPLLEEADWAFHPQLLSNGMATGAFRYSSVNATLLTETIDARVGLELLLTVQEDLRVAVGWTHQSGHISDNVPDPDLIGSNLGNEIFYVRVIREIPGRFRLGATLKPIPLSDPPIKAFAADQFGEWYPFGVSTSERKPTPYVSLGFEQYGTPSVQLSTNAQVGVFFGDHLHIGHVQSLRLALGYYNGVDPRLKYAQFKDGRAEFTYFGILFDL